MGQLCKDVMFYNEKLWGTVVEQIQKLNSSALYWGKYKSSLCS